MLNLSQKLTQLQKLSPQQIQYQKLLQLNTLSLEQRIKTELELNPLLEEEMDLKQEEKDSDDDFENETDQDKEEFALEDFMNDEDYFDDNANLNKNLQEDDRTEHIVRAKVSLTEHLLDQLNMMDLDDRLMILGEEIIGNLDKVGYLKQSLENIVQELEMFQHITITLEEAEAVLKEIQKFDPVGIGARSLQECLLIQIHYSSYDPYYSFLAEEMLRDHFLAFTQKRYDIIMDKMNLKEETLRSVLDLIQKLNPKPGEGTFGDIEQNQITPDFIIEKDHKDNYIIILNDRSLPTITVSKTYLEMIGERKGKRKLSDREKTTYKFLREKFESAKWFITCLEQRRDTLMKVMRAILERQYRFFEDGPKKLRPMIYKDIAEDISMDISTISRVANGKFVQSHQGIHELKYFFSEGLGTESGEEVSNKHIKERIKEIIESEKKNDPFSDEEITSILNEEGIHIARRTVAKYRESLRISVARLRKGL